MTRVGELRTVLTVPDFDEAVGFYRDMLGFDEIEDWTSDRGRVVLLEVGQATLEVMDERQAALVDDSEVGARVSGPVRLAVRVPDTETTASGLLGHGLEQVAPPAPTPWGSVNARFRTPDGLQLTLFTPG